LQPVGQQNLLLVELELVGPSAVQVTSLFCAQRGLAGNGPDCGVQFGFVLGMPLFWLCAQKTA
jgi:hypothetical protein